MFAYLLKDGKLDKNNIYHFEDIPGEFMKVPNVIANDRQLGFGEKYLYTYIQYWSYYGDFVKTAEIICNELGVCSFNEEYNCLILTPMSRPTLNKYLANLEKRHYIKIEYSRYNKHGDRKITPLITNSLIITEKNLVQAYRETALMCSEDDLVKKEVPDYVKEFVSRI